MPTQQAAFKALRQSKKRQLRNKKQKDEIKQLLKSVKKAIAANNKEEALKLLKLGYKKIDKAAKRHLIHKNNAARKKSRLMKKINALKK